MKARILIVEDDSHILLGLEEILHSENFEVAACTRGDEAVAAVKQHRPALVVLDVMLPGLSGYEVCRQLRAQQWQVPILMLTAKGQELDKVVGLELGADDYVTKPFGVRELLARIHALLRRAQLQSNPAVTDGGVFQIGPARIDTKRFELRRGSKVAALTSKELKLLQLFHSRPGEVLSREMLLKDIWGYNYCGTTRTLDQTIAQLRKKLGDDAMQRLVTVHGVGYKLTSK